MYRGTSLLYSLVQSSPYTHPQCSALHAPGVQPWHAVTIYVVHGRQRLKLHARHLVVTGSSICPALGPQTNNQPGGREGGKGVGVRECASWGFYAPASHRSASRGWLAADVAAREGGVARGGGAAWGLSTTTTNRGGGQHTGTQHLGSCFLPAVRPASARPPVSAGAQRRCPACTTYTVSEVANQQPLVPYMALRAITSNGKGHLHQTRRGLVPSVCDTPCKQAGSIGVPTSTRPAATSQACRATRSRTHDDDVILT